MRMPSPILWSGRNIASWTPEERGKFPATADFSIAYNLAPSSRSQVDDELEDVMRVVIAMLLVGIAVLGSRAQSTPIVSVTDGVSAARRALGLRTYRPVNTTVSIVKPNAPMKANAVTRFARVGLARGGGAAGVVSVGGVVTVVGFGNSIGYDALWTTHGGIIPRMRPNQLRCAPVSSPWPDQAAGCA
jgi:hypothetical protein